MPNLTPQGVLADLQPIFREALNEDNLIITRRSSAINTPNWDSLAHIELIEMVERHFKVHFGLSELQNFREVGDLVDLVVAQENKR
ncbi:MAG: acyl carrier protein [Terriglobales bacterium]|jgi:acyl carrier protein